MRRPMCINTKAQRKVLDARGNDSGFFGSNSLVAEYGELFNDIFKWSFTDKDMSDKIPAGYINDCIFWTGTVGITPDMDIVPGSGTKMNVYGYYNEWRAQPLQGYKFPWQLKSYSNISNPLLVLPSIPAYNVSEYCNIQATALDSLRQNAVGMEQPLWISGTNGEIVAQILDDQMSAGVRRLINVKDDGGNLSPIQVLDTGVQNFVDPLTGLVDATDCWILPLLGADAPTTQKASGQTVSESTTGSNRGEARRNTLLEMFRWWCDAVNEKFPIGIKVEISDAYDDRGNDRDNNGSGDVQWGGPVSDRADAGTEG